MKILAILIFVSLTIEGIRLRKDEVLAKSFRNFKFDKDLMDAFLKSPKKKG